MNIQKLLLGFILLIGLNSLAAQGPPHPPRELDRQEMEPNSERRGRIEAARKNFLKEEMGLTDAEAEKFFPLMKIYEEKIKDLVKKGRREYRSGTADEEMSEAEALQMIEEQMLHETDMLELRKASVKAYLEVIPAAKLVKLEPAKRAFRQKLMERMRRRRHN